MQRRVRRKILLRERDWQSNKICWNHRSIHYNGRYIKNKSLKQSEKKSYIATSCPKRNLHWVIIRYLGRKSPKTMTMRESLERYSSTKRRSKKTKKTIWIVMHFKRIFVYLKKVSAWGLKSWMVDIEFGVKYNPIRGLVNHGAHVTGDPKKYLTFLLTRNSL